MDRRALRLTTVSLMLLGACTWHPAAAGGPRNRNVISYEEFASTDATTAFEIVQRLRGEFLNSTRGKVTLYGSTRPTPVVYVDHEFYGQIELLRQIPANDVFEIRLYRSWEAVMKFGADKSAGVIEVVTRRQ